MLFRGLLYGIIIEIVLITLVILCFKSCQVVVNNRAMRDENYTAITYKEWKDSKTDEEKEASKALRYDFINYYLNLKD